MHKRSLTLASLALLVALVMAAANVGPARAEEATEVQVTGTVVSIDAVSFTFVLQPAEGAAITVNVAEGFDFGALAVGDVVEVTGTQNEDGSLSATSVQVQAPDDVVDETEITGTVVSIDEATLTIVIQTSEGETITVNVPEGFDFTTIAVDDQVEVKGTLEEDGSLTASEVKPEGEDDSEDKTGPSGGYYCQNPDDPHPFGARLAERYGVDYGTLLGWFCDGMGWGQIMLALQTGKISGLDPAALLEERGGGAGWGQIWKDHGLTNKSKQGNEAKDRDGDGLPDERGPNGHGHGETDDEGETDDASETGHGNGNGHGGGGGSSDHGKGNNGHGGGNH